MQRLKAGHLTLLFEADATVVTNMNETAHQTQTHRFQAEVQEVLRLMVHSLYSNREIFLRELISNASDACDKLRFEALRDESLLAGETEFRIEIEADEAAGTLAIRDNGIGMSFEEVQENIGTIARSGTRRFLEQATGDHGLDRSLIGQFGVGFYSAFIVADRVTVNTRKAGLDAAAGVRWTSDGQGEYEIAQHEREARGTEVILELKDDAGEFGSAWKLRELVARYSDHVGFPIRMRGETAEGDEDSAWETINQAQALWSRPRAEIEDDDYRAFYKHVSHDFDDPLAWSHNQVEGSLSYTSLLYLPSRAPLDLMLQRDERQGLRLYVRRVFIMDAAEHLLPHYLRFVRGVVDCDDLPLNVSRELLQDHESLSKIRSAVIRRTLDLLTQLAGEDSDRYQRFWDQFGAVLKEGIVEDPANRDKIAGLLRFASTHEGGAEQRVSLAEYLSRMPADQDTIWYITAENHRAALNSPHLEIFKSRGVEVLLLSDRIDEWMMGHFTEFDGKSLRSVAKGDVNLDTGENSESESVPADDQGLPDRIAAALGDTVSEVRASRRLTDSASCLVYGEQELALHMRRLLEQAGQELPDSKPVLEVNLEHPLLVRLAGLDKDANAFAELARLLHEQAVLAEGGQLEDPAGFVRRVNRLMMDLPA